MKIFSVLFAVITGKVVRKMQEDVDARYYELNKHKMLQPRMVAEKTAAMIFNINIEMELL